MKIGYYLKLMRVRHYIKNLLVFAALVCSGNLFSGGGSLLICLIGFVSFCLTSSAIYIINDIRDLEKDRLHPTKRNRPLASGKVSLKEAYILLAFILVAAVLCGVVLFPESLLLAVYLVMNLAYSFGLKNVPLIDVTILMAGFVIRVLYGALITDITISNWLYMSVITISFYFALGKRRNELSSNRGETRNVLKFYSINFLNQNMYMCLTLANVFYALWSMDEKTVDMYNSRLLILTVPIVLLISMKYSLDIEGEYDGDPVEVLTHDKTLIVLCAAYLAVMLLTLYL